MKINTLYIAIVIWMMAAMTAIAQEEKSALEILQQAKITVVEDEKAALMVEVEAINKRLEANEITFVEAEQLKKEAAQIRALNIENRLAIIDNKIALLERNGDDSVVSDSWLSFKGKSLNISFGEEKTIKYDRRTTSDLVFAFGLNNTIADGRSLEESPYKIGGSRFAELGIAWKTRVFKNSNWLRLKYGFSFQFNGLKADDNLFFVDQGTVTTLEEYPIDLDKSKLRMDNLVFPVHFEFGPSKKREKENYIRYSTNNKFRIGLGAYGGFNLRTVQKLKFEEDNEDRKVKEKSSFNTSNFIYGLSGYLGWGDAALYVKYDLNDMFKDNPVPEHNVSLGLRFDMD